MIYVIDEASEETYCNAYTIEEAKEYIDNYLPKHGKYLVVDDDDILYDSNPSVSFKI